MYVKSAEEDQMVFDFALPFGGRLNPENRWILLSRLIPWEDVEEQYARHFSENDLGCPAKPCRVALGALIIKERLGTSDEETVEQIRENPYLQYFLGLKGYTDTRLFDSSLMVHFRKRFTKEILADINERILTGNVSSQESKGEDDTDPPGGIDQSGSAGPQAGEETSSENKGKLIIDATCTPADIPYPTDLKLLNEVREKTEQIIDAMHKPYIGKETKPRTYRKRARKEYLSIVRQKKAGSSKIRAGIRKQLGYVKRNLKTINKKAHKGRLSHLSKRLYRLVLVSSEVYRQQQWMYENRSHRIPDRIVNPYQPHIRPIVRGKAGAPVEFGAKISVSLVDGYSRVDTLSWDPYNESEDLVMQAETYKQRYGCYPEAIQADKIYRTLANRRYCKKHGIRLSGPPLGRPPKKTENNTEQLKALKAQQRQDEKDRQAIEGKFGQGKRRFTLSRIMAKLAETSEAVIMVSFIVMNLEKILRDFLFFLFSPWDTAMICLRNVLSPSRGGEFCWPKAFAGFHPSAERRCGAA